MKKHLPILFIFILAATAAAQDPEQAPVISFHYKLLVEAPIYTCDLAGRPTEDTTIYAAPAQAVFSVIGKAGDNLIIRFWVWSDDEPEKQNTFNYGGTERSNRKYFLLSQDDFAAKAVPRYSTRASFSAGAIIIPIKARFSTFDFSTDVHIGPAVGARFRLSPYTNTNFFNALATFGVSTISLDSLSTSGVVRQPTDRPALTFSIGGVLEFSNAQIGFFIGCDYISQNETTRWRYQGKPWISLGMGYSIISRNSNPQASQEKRN